jgi:hypothetical protein
MVPTAGLSDQVTAGLLVPLTVAVNCWLPPPLKLAVAGLTFTETTCAGGFKVTVALADLEVSACEVAFTITLC